MAGNSARKGAVRKGNSRKGPSVGSGGQRRQGLEPRKATPKATERTGHPAARRARADEKRKPDGAPARRTRKVGAPARRTRKDGAEVVYGRNSVVEALRAGIPAAALYLQSPIDTDERIREAIDLSIEINLPLLEVPRSQLDDMTSRGAHQGILITVPAYEYGLPSDLPSLAAKADEHLLVVALDGVTDPRNLGAVIRSAAAFGAHGVVIPERRAAGVTASAWKTSAGAAARLAVTRATNLTRSLKDLAKSGTIIIGLDGDGDPLDEIDPEMLTGPIIFVIGSEGKGLSRLVRETCDMVVSIPIAAAVESLNASVAASIALHAAATARRARN